MTSERITLIGRNWTHEPAASPWQRERASGPIHPMEADFRGRWGLFTWLTTLVVVTLLICAVLS